MSSAPLSSAAIVEAAAEVEPAVEELRLAVALNGGVSLAVWMGGCAVELDRARRARGEIGGDERRVYDALCECFGRRLVIDILTGASAGGINGGLLGAAIAANGRLEPDFVRGRWLELGDLSRLLRAQDEEAPSSLMKGDLFHDDLRDAFETVLRRNPGPGPADRGALPEIVPSLDVTLTDVIGVERRFRDGWGGELVAREHRPRFKFRQRTHFTAEALAAAARTSASFPAAFEPWRVAGNARVLAGLPNPTYGIDGGLLDNAPIRAALDLIPTKTADSRVRRYVCYLNGDPTIASEETIGAMPTLREVGAYAVNLPRTAPLVDHLYAIRDAVERPRRTERVQTKLLRMDIDELHGVARALFDTYRQRRTMQSLEELFDEPGDAAALFEILQETGAELPWIPGDATPWSPRGWSWGQRPAQRTVHLLLDLMRAAIAAVSDEGARKRLLTTRKLLDEVLAQLGEARDFVTRSESQNNPSRFDEEAALERLQKAVTKAKAREAETLQAVVDAAEIFRKEAKRTSSAFKAGTFEKLFGTSEEEGEEIEHFFRRVLSIEVVRRTFSAEADIESAEELHFVQLTPDAPSPIFTAAPLDQRSPASAGSKLTGVGLGHFAGFYRRSWRANDFMWGRLDAAARIVDLFLDTPSNEVGVGGGENHAEQLEKRSQCLATALFSERLGSEGEWLLREALANAAGNAGDMAEEGGEAEASSPYGMTPAELREEVAKTIRTELEATGSGGGASHLPFTRAAFQRAAQLEIVRDELQHISDESATDRELGSAIKGIDLDPKKSGTLRGKIETIREIYAKGDDSLPKRLTARGEEVSDLGLRTITQASLVGLSAVRTAGVPMAKIFGLVRTPLLAVSGSVAKSRLARVTAAIGFWAAALFLTSRIVTAKTEVQGKELPLEFKTIWAPQTLTALVAVLGVLGIAAVPWLRTWRRVEPVRNLVFALGLLATAGGVAAIFSLTSGELDSVERVLFAPGSKTPPLILLLAPLAGLGIVSLSRLPLPPSAQKLAPLLKLFSSGWKACLLLILCFAALGAYSAELVLDELGSKDWKTFAGVLALAGAPVAIFFAASLAKGLAKPWRR